ncbi:hypothetical protein M3919_003915 [Vibrio parahaemolyticus]|uniref:hypothetical protein n=1 Tax=Vibrio parahaemolyticus TaxID=670 RepID=UPI003752ECE5|nr:hypothetical protein [Vibrio parahaemolyticus]EJE4158679.1 hypothetical protein [Vibrio parahaemolyticus]
MNKKLIIATILFSTSIQAKLVELNPVVNQQLNAMKSECESCSISMRDYLEMKVEFCNAKADANEFQKAFSSSPMVTALMTVHSMDKVLYRSQFIPLAKKNIVCDNDSKWLDVTRTEFTNINTKP